MKSENIKAVIFDMDGLLVDSEPLWRKSMVHVFRNSGIDFSEDDCRLTTGMRLKEVIHFWSKERPYLKGTPTEIHTQIIDHLCHLIAKSEVGLPGVNETINYCLDKSWKLGLATSSGSKLINTVLNKLHLVHQFDAVLSAENLQYGKPHPQVFLDCAAALNVSPSECLVLEDSVNGIIAGKAALMKVIAVPDSHNFSDPRFSIADYKISSLSLFPNLLNDLLNEVSAAK